MKYTANIWCDNRIADTREFDDLQTGFVFTGQLDGIDVWDKSGVTPELLTHRRFPKQTLVCSSILFGKYTSDLVVPLDPKDRA